MPPTTTRTLTTRCPLSTGSPSGLDMVRQLSYGARPWWQLVRQLGAPDQTIGLMPEGLRSSPVVRWTAFSDEVGPCLPRWMIALRLVRPANDGWTVWANLSGFTRSAHGKADNLIADGKADPGSSPDMAIVQSSWARSEPC